MSSNGTEKPTVTVGDGTTSRPVWDLRMEEGLGDSPQTILVLETVEVNRRLLRGLLKSESCRILEAASEDAAFRELGRSKVDLIILDLATPDVDGLRFCRHIKSGRATRFVPILTLTSVQGTENEIAGINSGADEFLVKPLQPAIVRARIRAMLRHKSAIDSLEEAESILFALAQAVEARDKYTRGHCSRLATLSVAMGTALGLSRPQLVALHRGGFLHDIGKICVPDAVLFKPGPLDHEEWAIMRMHTTKGEEICRPARSLSAVLPIIRNHHEKWDGSGYPDGLRREAIPLLARIMQVADIFDALVTDRPYKPALAASEAVEVLEAEARKGWREWEMVRLLREVGESSDQAALPEAEIEWTPDPVSQSLANMQHVLGQ